MKWKNLAVAAVLCAGASPAVAQSPQATLKQAAILTMANFTHAWQASDARALARNFAPDADFIGPDGTRASGRPAIQAFYRAAFAHGYAGSHGTGKLRFVRKIAPDLAIVDASWSIDGAKNANGSPRAAEPGILVAVLRKHAGRWAILALRENEGAANIQAFAAR